MKKVTVKLYEFKELSEKAQQKVLEKFYDINVDHGWWENVYEDAENIGLKIEGFDLYHYSACGEFNMSANEVAANILKEHGDSCETYKTAENFMEKWQPVFDEYMNENSDKYESRESEDELLNLESEFLKSLLEDYRIILHKEYEYRTSKEAIIETIECNAYLFTEDGKLF